MKQSKYYKGYKIFLLFGVYILFGCNTKTKSSAEDNIDSIRVGNEHTEYLNTEDNDSILLSPNEGKDNRHTTIIFPNYKVTIKNFETRESDISGNDILVSPYPKNFEYIKQHNWLSFIAKKDTISLTAFQYLSDIELLIISNKPQEHYRVLLCLNESVDEVNNDEENYETQYKKNFHWKGQLPYLEAKQSFNLNFKLPHFNMDSIYLSPEIKVQLRLRDTSVFIPQIVDTRSEPWEAKLVRDNYCTYSLDEGIIKILRYSGNKLLETKYISILYESEY